MTRTLHRAFAVTVTALVLLCGGGAASAADTPYRASATSRIKDLANIEGVRQNQLIGYGLVVGLNGTGDTLNNIPFTKQSLQAMLERLGVNIRGATIRTGNVAAVMVTSDVVDSLYFLSCTVTAPVEAAATVPTSDTPSMKARRRGVATGTAVVVLLAKIGRAHV